MEGCPLNKRYLKQKVPTDMSGLLRFGSHFLKPRRSYGSSFFRYRNGVYDHNFVRTGGIISDFIEVKVVSIPDGAVLFDIKPQQGNNFFTGSKGSADGKLSVKSELRIKINLHRSTGYLFNKRGGV
jgi:hypothetical protein